jgi:cyclomaltodextrinase
MDKRMNHPPAWVNDAIFYQIFPERFANGDPSNDPSGVQPWGGKPTGKNFFGGDLQGIIDHLDYVKDLGANTIYLNPVFASSSNHKYTTSDYMKIDPEFGTNDLFKKLVDTCHQKEIRIIIDGVFNHTGVDFWAFEDIKKNGAQSKYAAWYNIYSYPVGTPNKPNYECWWKLGGLPKLMVENPDVKKYLFDVARYWTSMGIDGWRLDVPNEIPHDFWMEWRELVKSINPECYIVGEIWEDASAWLRGDQFDGVMNYLWRRICLDFFCLEKTSAKEFDEQLAHLRSLYSPDANYDLQNLLGSHDTERYLTLCDGDVAKVKLSVLFQMTYLGAPMVYYGDEIGMEGGKDPDCRRTMIWDQSKWNKDLRAHFQKMISLRNEYPALRRGEFQTIASEDDLFVFKRSMGVQNIFVALNPSSNGKDFKISSGKQLKDAVTGKILHSENGMYTLSTETMSGRILVEE